MSWDVATLKGEQLLTFKLLLSCKEPVSFVTMCNVERHFCEEKYKGKKKTEIDNRKSVQTDEEVSTSSHLGGNITTLY